MGIFSMPLHGAPAPWKLPACFMLLATLAVPAWQSLSEQPLTGALTTAPATFTALNADTVIFYAAPADADPFMRISSRGDDGQWKESELQLSNAEPLQSALRVQAAVAQEISGAVD